MNLLSHLYTNYFSRNYLTSNLTVTHENVIVKLKSFNYMGKNYYSKNNTNSCHNPINTRYAPSPASSRNHFGQIEAADELIPTHNQLHQILFSEKCCFHNHGQMKWQMFL